MAKSGKFGRPRKPQSVENQRARSSVEATRGLATQAEIDKANAIIGETFSMAAVAAALGVTARTIQNYLRDGKLRGVKVAGEWRVTAANLKRFIEGE